MFNTLGNICHAFCLIFFFSFLQLHAQTYRPTLPPPPASASGTSQSGPPTANPPSPNIDQPVRVYNDADPELVHIRSITQEVEGHVRHLRGMVIIETQGMRLSSDELDYNEETGDVEARGHVHYENKAEGETIDCEKADYNVDSETGKFYDVSGTSLPRIQARVGLLTTTNPFYFQSNWAEKVKGNYILHSGFITDCKVPRPWWRLKSSKFVVVPNEHSTTRNAIFYLRQYPVFYFPFFYKSLKKEPRRSGFLLPNVGNSSTRGQVFGLGYYWAINRSYDLTYRARYFTTAGLAHHLDFRGDPNARTVFSVMVDGIKDQRPTVPSGALVQAHLRSYLGHGWEAKGDADYISSFGFRQNFTESFNEAVFAQTHSVGFVTKHWSDYAINLVTQQNVIYQDATAGNDISIRKLPEAQFLVRQHLLEVKQFPFWFSMDSSAGLLARGDPSANTRPFMPRMDFAPHLTTAFHFAGIRVVPTVGIRETFYGSSTIYGTGTAFDGRIIGNDLTRSSRDATVDLILPSLQRIFDAPSFFGEKLKHVIEPRVTYTNVSGINNFNQTIHFDETDILANTNQVEFSLTNRLLAKAKNGAVTDLLTWRLAYDRYFDPTFGGAITPGQRNVVQSELDLTGYSFLNGYRNSSPIASSIRVQSKIGLEWRTDYDPIRHAFVASSITADTRLRQWFIAATHTTLKTDPVIAPSANQFFGRIVYGGESHRGFNYGVDVRYDFRLGVTQYVQSQIVYNTDCCGFSVQYRLVNIPGIRNESQFRLAFAISNIGTFGNLRRQERIF